MVDSERMQIAGVNGRRNSFARRLSSLIRYFPFAAHNGPKSNYKASVPRYIKPISAVLRGFAR